MVLHIHGVLVAVPFDLLLVIGFIREGLNGSDVHLHQGPTRNRLAAHSTASIDLTLLVGGF